MKKIFTLIAVAAMALSANAQTYKVTAAPTLGESVTSVANMKFTYGGTAGKTWSLKDNKPGLVDAIGYPQRTDGDGANPVDADSKAWDKSGNIPVSGTYYIFEPSAAGNVEAYFVINGSKRFVILEDGIDITNEVTYKAYDEEGGESVNELDESTLMFNDKVYALVTFPVKAGSKYYAFICGSKMGFGGFTFPAATSAGIQSVKAAAQNEGVAYNLAGQKVANDFKGIVVKNGVKFLNK